MLNVPSSIPASRSSAGKSLQENSGSRRDDRNISTMSGGASDAQTMTLWQKTRTTLEMIKWEHSVFALPFALTGALLAASGWPRLGQLFWIVVCMVLARSAGMAFNRWADSELDAANPRTKTRAIPAGLLSRQFVGWFALVAAALFVAAAAQLNRLTLLLAPVAIGI